MQVLRLLAHATPHCHIWNFEVGGGAPQGCCPLLFSNLEGRGPQGPAAGVPLAFHELPRDHRYQTRFVAWLLNSPGPPERPVSSHASRSGWSMARFELVTKVAWRRPGPSAAAAPLVAPMATASCLSAGLVAPMATASCLSAVVAACNTLRRANHT